MRGHSDDWIANRILRSLSKRGFPDGRIVVGRDCFDVLPPEMRSIADIGSVGHSVVGFVGGDQLWTLLGTEAVYSCKQGQVIDFKLDNLRALSLIDNTQPSPCEYIELIDQHGARKLIWGPSGEGCLALYGALLTLLRLGKPNEKEGRKEECH